MPWSWPAVLWQAILQPPRVDAVCHRTLVLLGVSCVCLGRHGGVWWPVPNALVKLARRFLGGSSETPRLIMKSSLPWGASRPSRLVTKGYEPNRARHAWNKRCCVRMCVGACSLPCSNWIGPGRDWGWHDNNTCCHDSNTTSWWWHCRRQLDLSHYTISYDHIMITNIVTQRATV
jgi:hypothetical protein